MRYIILILSLYTPLHCMKSLIEKESPYRFKNITILSYDGWEQNAITMAKNAMLVHCNTNTHECSKRHPDIKNLFFRQPQRNAYDLITVYDPCMFNKQNILIHLKAIYDYLAPSGKFCFFIRTQSNNLSAPEKALVDVFCQIRKPTKPLKSKYFSDDELKKIIWKNGYNIDSYQHKMYETVIKDRDNYLEELATTFVDKIRNYNLPETRIKELTEHFLELVIQRNKKNRLDQLIESWSFTKITLCKADKLRPPFFLNNSLLSTEWS